MRTEFVTAPLTHPLSLFLVDRSIDRQTQETPGHALMNLRRVGGPAASRGARDGTEGAALTRQQRLMWTLLSAVLPYAARRSRDAMASARWGSHPPGSWRRRLWDASGLVARAAPVATVVNSLAFFGFGVYPTIAERLVGVRSVPARRDVGRSPDFEELSRQLVWRELSETLLYVLPVLSAHGARARAMMRGIASSRASQAASAAGDDDNAKGCTICGAARCAQPYTLRPCGHRFCYYCVSAAAEDARRRGVLPYRCATCFEAVEGMQRVLSSSEPTPEPATEKAEAVPEEARQPEADVKATSIDEGGAENATAADSGEGGDGNSTESVASGLDLLEGGLDLLEGGLESFHSCLTTRSDSDGNIVSAIDVSDDA